VSARVNNNDDQADSLGIKVRSPHLFVSIKYEAWLEDGWLALESEVQAN
jgi:hypothetical protein